MSESCVVRPVLPRLSTAKIVNCVLGRRSFRWLSIATSGGCWATSAAEKIPLSLQVRVLLGVLHAHQPRTSKQKESLQLGG